MDTSRTRGWTHTRRLMAAVAGVGVTAAGGGLAAASPAAATTASSRTWSTIPDSPHTITLTSTSVAVAVGAPGTAVAATRATDLVDLRSPTRWQVGVGTGQPRVRTGAAA